AGVGLVALFVVVFARTPASLRPMVSTMIWSGIGLALVATGVLLPYELGAGQWRHAFLVAAVLGVAVTIGLRPGAWEATGFSIKQMLRPRRAGGGPECG